MTDRKETTKHLTELLRKHINPNNDTRIYTAAEVTFDYYTEHPIRIDYMRFKPVNNSQGGIERGSFYCFEVKSCKEDFESGHGLNFIGDFNYLVLPEGLYDQLKRKIPYDVGVYEPSGDIWKPLKCVKKARQITRNRSAAEMLLMMFRSANRELIKTEG